jgi:hypothetical protein
MDSRGREDACLKRVLLAEKTRSLALPESSSFERLQPNATNVPTAGSTYFATHTTYQIPIDIGEHVRPGQSLTNKKLVDVVHRFTVRRSYSGPMNERLTRWGLHKEQLAKECEGRLIHVAPGRGSDAGVSKTNVGGYQSFHDLFEPPSADDEGPPSEAKLDCLLLHRVVSAALDAARAEHEFLEAAKTESEAEAEAAAYAQEGAGGVAEAPYGETADDVRAAADTSLHAAYAWLNVNRTRDSNFMHTHQVDLWSAVYYVNEGEPNAPGFAHEASGHMIFRAGPRPDGEGGPSKGLTAGPEESEPCRSYFAVPPSPGTLWLFPGSMPHTVMPTVLPDGLDEPETPRISIGINFEVAVPPLPRPWRVPVSLRVRQAMAAAAAAKEDAEDALEVEGAGEPAMQSMCRPGAPPKAADRTPQDARAPRETAGSEADDEPSPFLMMNAAEARAAGFREDEEVVMPMPVFSDSEDDE